VLSSRTKEVRELVELVQTAGWRVLDKGAHFQALSPDGRSIVTLHKTPSASKWRRRAEGDFRRYGLDVRAVRRAKGLKGENADEKGGGMNG
jgi:hypothetical protein